MVTLEKITEANFKKILDMKVDEMQGRFVDTNAESLAEAWLWHDHERPFAVCNDGEVVGFIMLSLDKTGRKAEIPSVMIAPEHQHKGYGKQALLRALDHLKKLKKYDSVSLTVVPGNTVGERLYTELGFVRTGEYRDGEIVMRFTF